MFLQFGFLTSCSQSPLGIKHAVGWTFATSFASALTLELDHHAVTGGEGTFEIPFRRQFHPIELVIGAGRIVMEHRESFRVRRPTEARGLLPGGMTIAAILREFLFGKGAV